MSVGAMTNGWNAFDPPPFSIGFVNVPAFLVITPVVMLLAPLGSKSANQLSDQTFKWSYAGLLGFITMYMVVHTWFSPRPL